MARATTSSHGGTWDHGGLVCEQIPYREISEKPRFPFCLLAAEAAIACV